MQTWAVDLERLAGHNKATCALANKLARIAWVTWYYERDFESRSQGKCRVILHGQ